ncbi:TPA: hypothetical protein ACOQ5E_002163, partial [Bacillus cereus]
ANCSVLQGGIRRKDYRVIYSVDGILSFIQGWFQKSDIPPKYKVIRRTITMKTIKEIFLLEFFISRPPL